MYIIIAVIVSVFVLLLLKILVIDKLRKRDNEAYNDLVISNLSRKDSELYKFVEQNLKKILDENVIQAPSEYEMFKFRIALELADLVNQESDNKNGYKWLNSSVEDKIDQYNIAEAIVTIIDSEDIDSMVAKIFNEQIESGIEEAKNNENIAVEANKKFDSAPGKDEELHPRVPQPGDDSEIEIEEKSIEELSSMGTVESVDD